MRGDGVGLDCSPAEIRFALDAVRRASHLAERVRAELAGASFSKGDRSPVTVADYAVQAMVGCLLAEAFPSDPLLAEEDSTALRRLERQATLAQVAGYVARVLPGTTPQAVCTWIDRGGGAPARRFWTLDPVDGTKGFLRGGQYAVALALIEDAQVRIGVLGCPNLTDPARPESGGPGSLVVAVRGGGTWRSRLDAPGDFSRLRVSACHDPGRAVLLRSVEADHTDVALTAAVARVLGLQAAPVLMDSQAKYAVLAAGGGDLLLRLPSPRFPDYRENIWDQAAGCLVVEEAGGRLTDAWGERLDFSSGRRLSRNCGVLASNGRLHAAALRALRALCRGGGEGRGGRSEHIRLDGRGDLP